MKLYVKKVCSINPKKYCFISYEEAIKGYDNYIKSFFSIYETVITPKSFELWLETEL